MVAKVRLEHALSGQPALAASQLKFQELIIPRHIALRDIIFSYCYRAGFVPHIAGEVSLPAGQDLLLDTSPKKRVVLLLREVDGGDQDGCRILPLTNPPCVVNISMAWSNNMPLRPSLAAFRDYILNFYLNSESPETKEA